MFGFGNWSETFILSHSLLRANKLSQSEQIKISILERGKCFFSLTAKDRFFFSIFVNDFEREAFEKTTINNNDLSVKNSNLSEKKQLQQQKERKKLEVDLKKIKS